MPKYEHWLKTRVGTCRSGLSFDLPHELNLSQINGFLKMFSNEELVDIYCMTEAVLSRYKDNLQTRRDFRSIQLINKHLNSLKESPALAKEFKERRLKVSPDYVRHGLKLLLS